MAGGWYQLWFRVYICLFFFFFVEFNDLAIDNFAALVVTLRADVMTQMRFASGRVDGQGGRLQ